MFMMKTVTTDYCCYMLQCILTTSGMPKLEAQIDSGFLIYICLMKTRLLQIQDVTMYANIIDIPCVPRAVLQIPHPLVLSR